MKASALQRRTPLKTKTAMGRSTEKKPAARPRKRKCSNCGETFQQARMGQQVCGPSCAQSFARRISEQQERKRDRERKQALKSRRDWAREAQAAVNTYIRERDAALPCISCGRHHDGQNHAGHYLSRGAHPHLAYEENNLAKQCMPCNVHLSGNQVLFRAGLVRRIGLAAVEALEADQAPRKYTIDDLRAIKAHYAAKVRELKKEQA